MIQTVKKLTFLGDSLELLRQFPAEMRRQAGFELRKIQWGQEPSDWKPMSTIGAGVREIRLREANGAYRVI